MILLSDGQDRRRSRRAERVDGTAALSERCRKAESRYLSSSRSQRTDHRWRDAAWRQRCRGNSAAVEFGGESVYGEKQGAETPRKRRNCRVSAISAHQVNTIAVFASRRAPRHWPAPTPGGRVPFSGDQTPAFIIK